MYGLPAVRRVVPLDRRAPLSARRVRSTSVWIPPLALFAVGVPLTAARFRIQTSR
jgi:hypothetical protein